MSEDDAAPWLATMRELAGTKEFPGGDNNPTILGWASFIGNTYPEMAAYAALYTSDAIAWCGLTEAYALAKNGIRPPFGSSDTERFLWANSFAAWGLKLDAPQPGAIVVFKWKSGGGHVGTIDHVIGRTLYVAGGNQSDAVNTMPFAWDDQVVGFFWPPKIAAQPSAVRTPADVRMRMGKAIVAEEARRDKLGRLAVYSLPANDGGGAYEVAGINVRYHPIEAAKLKAMIEAGQYQQAEDFADKFIASYTDVADLWTSSWGVEFYLRDSVFNRGPTGAAKILQRALIILGDTVGPDGVDGDVGPNTMAAIGRQEANPGAVLTALRKAREDYEREVVGYRANLWNGLVNRWNDALSTAQLFQIEQQKETPVADDTTTNSNDQVLTAINGLRADIAQLVPMFGALVNALKSIAPPTPPIADPAPAPVSVPAPVPASAPAPASSVLQSPGVGLGIMGAGLSIIMQMLGVPVMGEGATAATQAVPAVAVASTALGLSGWGGMIANALGTVLPMIFKGLGNK